MVINLTQNLVAKEVHLMLAHTRYTNTKSMLTDVSLS